MKQFLLAIGVILPLFLQAQSEVDVALYINVKNSSESPVPFLDFSVINEQTGERFDATSDRNGRTKFNLPAGFRYLVIFEGAEVHAQIDIPARGRTIVTKTLTYDPPAKEHANNSVSDTLWQDFDSRDRPNRNEGLLKIQIRRRTNRPLANYQVDLTCRAIGKVFSAKTNHAGVAYFKVPVNKRYLIGLEGWAEYSSVMFPDYPGGTYRKSIMYEPTELTEHITNDTIRQEADEITGPTSSRLLLNVQIVDYSRNPLPDEEVTILNTNDSTVYLAMTDQNGRVKFLLPKKDPFTINLRYERNLGYYDFSDKKGFGTFDAMFGYRGSQNIEEFYETAERDRNGFITKFEESPVEPFTVIGTEYLTRTEHGFEVKFDGTSPSSTPAVGEGKLFMSGDIRSEEFYCLDAKTGKVIWSTKLSEGGASSAVYENGVVLVTTESCTLYALDAKDGKLLWSKWLSAYLFSTPSVQGNEVYAVYGNDLGSINGSVGRPNKYVLASFDLATGEIRWQNWLDHEALATPVLTDKKVYLTTFSGSLFAFNRGDGKLIRKAEVQAISPPTIVGGTVYAARLQSKTSGLEMVGAFDANLVPVRKDKKIMGTGVSQNQYNDYPVHAMNYNGARPLFYQGKLYSTLGNELICAEAYTGAIVWSAKLGEQRKSTDPALATMPTLVAGKIALSTRDGKLNFYDPNSGKMVREFDLEAQLWTQASVNEGWIYSGSKDGKTIAYNTREPALTGWPMWGGNGAHNTAYPESQEN